MQGTYPAETDDLGVVVLSYGAGPVGEVVNRLLRTGLDPAAIVVVHNSSEFAPRPPPLPSGISVIATGRNLGYGDGMNHGIRLWRQKRRAFVALVTHDVDIDGTDLIALRDAMAVDPSIGLIAPALHDAMTTSLLSAGGVVGPTGRVRHITDASWPVLIDVDWVDGAVVVLRADGPLVPDDYFLYFEDVALGWQVRNEGKRVCCKIDIVARTSPASSGRRELFRYLSWRNRVAFARRSLGFVGTVGAASHLIAAAVTRSFSELKRRGPRSAWNLTRLFATALVHGLSLQLGPVEPGVAVLVCELENHERYVAS